MKKNYEEIEAMSNSEWLKYEEEKLKDFYERGYVLKPTVGCSTCNIDDEYICIDCERKQIEEAV